MAEKGKWTDEEVGKLMDFWAEELFNFPWIMLKLRRRKRQCTRLYKCNLSNKVGNLVLYDIHGLISVNISENCL